MTKSTGLSICDECYEYVEDCTCGQYDSEDEAGREADDWLDKQKDIEGGNG